MSLMSPCKLSKHVVRLDIAVDHAVFVQMSQTFEHFATDSGDLALGHDIAGHHVGETATLHVLHDHPQVAFEQK